MLFLSVRKDVVLRRSYDEVMEILVGYLSCPLECRNQVECIFPDYDHDPREITDIPEIVDWFAGSIEAGVPWFHFLNCDTSIPTTMETLFFLFAGERDKRNPSFSYLEPDKVIAFLEKGCSAAQEFSEKYNISLADQQKAGECLFDFVKRVYGSQDYH